jgi:hypothetical protein
MAFVVQIIFLRLLGVSEEGNDVRPACGTTCRAIVAVGVGLRLIQARQYRLPTKTSSGSNTVTGN